MPYHFSDQTDDALGFERIESFGGGMDAFTRSTLLPPDVSQYLRNMVVLDNLEARTRPGANTLAAAVVTDKRIQGLCYFDTPNVERVLAACNGEIYSWNGTAWAKLTPAVAITDASRDVEFAQGIDKVLICDGSTSAMQTWDGTNFVSLGTGATDPPTGARILCWHTGRMFAAGFAGGTSGKENDAIWVSNTLSYGAGDWDGTTRQFRVGGGEGDPIKALVSLQDFLLCVLKENSIWLCATDPTDVPASFSASQAVEAVGFGIGCVGKRAWATYGNDLLFMARDGVYSLRRMQAASGQYELSAPLSQPIQSYIDRINWTYADIISAVRYKQYVLFAVPLDSSTTNNAVLAFNGRLGKWVGIWDGWAPSHWAVTRFSGNHRMIFGQANGKVRQWADNSAATDDDTYLDDGSAIPSGLHTRSFLFGEPVNDKDLYHVEMRFSTGSSNISVTVMADNAESKEFSIEAKREELTLPLTLPFTLTSPGNLTLRKGLRGLPAFNECYLKIESDSGWWSLRNITLSAFLNMLQNE